MANDPVQSAVTRFCDARREGRPIPPRAAIETAADEQTTREVLHGIRLALRSTRVLDRPGDHAADTPPEVWPDVPGYDLVDLVGRGGMGVVYEAFQRTTGQRVAIKMVRAGWDDEQSASLATRLQREVELGARLHHPGIVRLLDAGTIETGRRPYCVMEFVDGRTLDAACPPGEGNPRESLRMLAEIADAVDYAHQRGVLHRDLKPGNIIVDPHGRPRVLDFGLAKAIDPATRMASRGMTLSEPGQILGTLGYMPPEQAAGRLDEISVRSDVYSLGVIGYELVTGRLPVEVDGPLAEALRNIERVDPPAPSSVAGRTETRGMLTRDLDAVLLKALEKSPAGRYATAGEFAAEIRRLLEGRTVVARPIGPGGKLARWTRRNRALAAITGGAITLIIVITAIAFYRVIQERNAAIASAEQRGQLQRNTLEALNKVVFETNDALSQTLGAERVRAELTDRAFAYFEALRSQPIDAATTASLAPALGKLGDALAERGETARGVELHSESLRLLKTLPKDVLLTPAARRDLAHALARVGSDSGAAGIDLLVESVAVFHELRSASPTPMATCEEAQALLRLAVARLRSGESQGASRAAGDCVELLTSSRAMLDADRPLAAQAIDLMRRCASAVKSVPAAPAASWLDSAREWSESLAARDPDDMTVLRTHLNVIIARAELAIHAHDGRAAAAILDPARERTERALLAQPNSASLRVAAADFFRGLGSTVVELPGAAPEQLRRAAADYRRARELSGELFRANRNSPAYADKHILALINGAAACARLSGSDPAVLAEATDSYREYLSITDPNTGTRSGDAYLRAFALSFLASHATANSDPGEPAPEQYLRRALAELEHAGGNSPQIGALRSSIQADLNRITGDDAGASRPASKP